MKEIWLIEHEGEFWTHENGWNTLDKGPVVYTSCMDAWDAISNLTEDWEDRDNLPIAVGFKALR